MVSPLKKGMNYSTGTAPKGVAGVSMGDGGKKGSTPTKVMKGARPAGEMYKKPSAMTLKGKSAKDQSSGQSNPTKGGDDNKKRYAGMPQPVQFSNADQPSGTCKFVC